MKKQSKSDAGILGFIAKIHEQLALLDKKVDVLITKTIVAKPPEIKPFSHPKPFQQQANAHAQAQRQNERFRERVMHKAICADCRKQCEVPFRPSQDRPVYCQECFSRRKGGNAFGTNTGNRPKTITPIHTASVNRLQPVKAKKTVTGKKPASKKKKSKK